MYSICVLAIVCVVVVHMSTAAPQTTRSPAKDRRGQQHRGRGPSRVPRVIDKETKDRMRANCNRKSNRCRDQTNEYRKTRNHVKSTLMQDFKHRERGISNQEADRRAEMRLAKIHELKRIINAKHNLTDIEPADDGLWQKDIILSDKQIELISKQLRNPNQHKDVPTNKQHKRSAAWYFEKNPEYLWKMPIHYWIDDNYNATEQSWIEDALKTLVSNVGCLQFTRDTTKLANGSQIQYLKPDSCCCWGTSYVGCLGPTYVNPVNIAVGCEAYVFKGRVFHETIHALGGGHEQSRTDRDYHIEILWDNIDPQQWSQYQIDDWSTSYGLPYDFRSVMHYQQGGFALAYNLDTMKPYVDTELGNDYMSANDIAQLKRMYCLQSTCTDSYQDCGNWANFNYCTDPERASWMTQFCARSCGSCQ